MRFAGFLAVFAAAFLLFFSCTRAEPEIDFWTARFVYQQEGENIIPTLIFFVIAGDPDGPEDLDELRLYHDDEALMWRFNSENWIKLEDGGKTWLGSKMLRMPAGETFPSGQYRAVVIDKGGEQGEKTFGFEPPREERYPFPKLTVEDGRYTVVSNYPENYILCYHNDGVYRNLIKLESKTGSLSSLRLAADVYSIALWADDSANSLSALTNSANVR